MTLDLEKLTPATSEDIAESLAFALRFNRGKRVHDTDDSMARIVAQRLVEHLVMSGYAIMKKPPTAAHSTPAGRQT